MISEKYLAGFIDADGHFGVRYRVGATPDLIFVLSQRIDRVYVIQDLREMFDVAAAITVKGKYANLSLRCGPAVRVMERLAKYMVMRRRYVEWLLVARKLWPVMRDQSDIAKVKAEVKAARRWCDSDAELPNYPTRKWMAGYIDADGCFSGRMCNHTFYPKLTFLTEPFDTEAIRLVHKAFGGAMHTNKDGNVVLDISLGDPSKAIEVLEFCAPHLEAKKAVAYFLLGCAKNGNFRDGDTIHKIVKQLNSQEQRLSDPTSEAARLLSTVKFDIPKMRQGRPPGVKDTKPRKPKMKR